MKMANVSSVISTAAAAIYNPSVASPLEKLKGSVVEYTDPLRPVGEMPAEHYFTKADIHKIDKEKSLTGFDDKGLKVFKFTICCKFVREQVIPENQVASFIVTEFSDRICASKSDEKNSFIPYKNLAGFSVMNSENGLIVPLMPADNIKDVYTKAAESVFNEEPGEDIIFVSTSELLSAMIRTKQAH